MTSDAITAEMIADNHHTPPQLAQMIYKCKGADKVCVVSDAIAAAGGTNGQRFTLGSGENCTKVFVEDGVAIMEDKTHYAGSVQALDQMVQNLVYDAGICLVDAVRMASLTPAEVVGIAGECGSIQVGKRADFCIADSHLHVKKTIVEGKIVYEG
jgi:N-acetylglucosamine-6-phosphate deacetylase